MREKQRMKQREASAEVAKPDETAANAKKEEEAEVETSEVIDVDAPSPTFGGSSSAAAAGVPPLDLKDLSSSSIQPGVTPRSAREASPPQSMWFPRFLLPIRPFLL